MNVFSKYKKKLICAGLCLALSAGAFQSYAANYNKVGDGVYQLLDGTAITGVVARGIDVSHWQGTIDWAKVAADDISFVMLGTRYSGNVDPRFHDNARNAHANGIKLGAYIYSYATDVAMAEAEADFILDLVKDYPISYPIAFDLEANVQSTLSPQLLAEMVNAFSAKIKAAGYHPMLYANDYWLANKIDMSMVSQDVWVARYEVKHNFATPVMWQATSTGSVNGISGNVDIDFQYKDFSGVIAPNLWRTIGGKTYYYQDFVMQKDSWIHDGNGWYYMNGDGLASTGWLDQGSTSYYLDAATGRMAQGWLSMSDGWRYFSESGAMQRGWASDGTAWYYLDQAGLMKTGWMQDQNTWYYLRESGAMATGWQQVDNQWYYFNGSGAMKTGWIGDDTAWYYLDLSTGAMFTNTQITVDGVTYQVDASGVCTPVVSGEEAAAPDGAAGPGETSAPGPGNDMDIPLITPIAP